MFSSSNITLVSFEMVCEEAEGKYVPSSLVSNIHPLMMVQRKREALFQVIHDKIGNSEINVFT